MEAAWTRSTSHALQHFNVDPKIGLSPESVRTHQALYGRNGTNSHLSSVDTC